MSRNKHERNESHQDSEAIEEFYRNQLESFKPNSSRSKAMALCPFHSDKNPSLSIDLNTGNYYCHSCEEGGTLKKFKRKIGEIEEPDTVQHTCINKNDDETGREVAVYAYEDESGQILFEAVRYEPKSFRYRTPDLYHDHAWNYSLAGVRLVPYNLPEIISVEGKTVYIVEGEKDVESLRSLGLTATCNPMGAGKWKAEYNRYFKDKSVVIIPDNDEAGKKHADTIVENLLPIAKSAKVLQLPDLPGKGDISDWLDSGGTKKRLKELVEETREIRSLESYFLSRCSISGSKLMNIDIKIEWLVDKLIPKQSITLLHGRGGIGKTWLSLKLADAVSRGESFMGLSVQKFRVVYIDYENSLPVLAERVRAVRAAKTRFWHISNSEKIPPKLDSKNWEDFKKLPNSLLIFDTLRAAQSMDENSSKDMAFILSRLKELRDAGFTIVLLHHTPKSNDRTYKGSTAILDLADHVLSLQKVKRGKPDDEADDDDSDSCYRFGTKDKTRYEPFHLFLEFKPEEGFILTEDPDEKTMSEMQKIIEQMKERNKAYPKQKEIMKEVKEQLSLSADKIRKLLKRGTGNLWEAEREKSKNALIYKPL